MATPSSRPRGSPWRKSRLSWMSTRTSKECISSALIREWKRPIAKPQPSFSIPYASHARNVSERNIMRIPLIFLILIDLSVSCCAAIADEPRAGVFKAGVARRVITPAEPMWMAGYGNRNKPAEGKIHDLFVKALALEDPAGGKLVLLTSDLVGIPRDLSERVAAEVRQKTGLPRERLMLTCSHTHCGPVLLGSLIDMYDMPPEEAAKIAPYTERVRGWMVEAITA